MYVKEKHQILTFEEVEPTNVWLEKEPKQLFDYQNSRLIESLQLCTFYLSDLDLGEVVPWKKYCHQSHTEHS